jgi:hypothetical protein
VPLVVCDIVLFLLTIVVLSSIVTPPWNSTQLSEEYTAAAECIHTDRYARLSLSPMSSQDEA